MRVDHRVSDHSVSERFCQQLISASHGECPNAPPRRWETISYSPQQLNWHAELPGKADDRPSLALD